MDSNLIPPHGGYRQLLTFRLAQLTYDITVKFCDRFINIRSRTHDQMVQAARSGVQNIAEGSQVSGTSKKMELKLTQVARASLEELKLDYEDYLRQRELPMWAPDDPVLVRFKARRCSTLRDFRLWVRDEVNLRGGLCPSVFVANGALSLLNVICHHVDQQVESLARSFEKDGGFTERLYRARSANRLKATGSSGRSPRERER